jgi:acylaminoacyl-peptidase
MINADPYKGFRYISQLGEGFSGKKRPTLYLFRWGTSTEGEHSTNFTRLTALSLPQSHGHVLLGQALFISQDRILATGFEYTESGRLLGLKGCFNRTSSVCMLEIPGTIPTDSSPTLELKVLSRLTPADYASRSPRELSEKSMAFWISNAAGGAHASCVSLHAIDLQSMEQRTILDTVWEASSDRFPGLYMGYSLPVQPFITLGSVSYITTHSVWGSRSTVLLIATDDGRVRDLTPDDDEMLYNWTVLSTDGQRQIICARSSPSIPEEVVLGRINDAGTVSWQILSQPTLRPQCMYCLRAGEILLA